MTFDDQGFLNNHQDWTPKLATLIAADESIELTEQHWQVIYALRDFYQQYELSPAMRPLIKHLQHSLNNTTINSIYLLQLFPGSPAKLASKIAGLPKPENCL